MKIMAVVMVVMVSAGVVVTGDAVTTTSLPYDGGAVFGIAEKVYMRDAGTGEAIVDEVVEMRRMIHQKPETMYDEYETSAFVASKLREMGIAEHNIRTGVAITGVVAHIGAGTLEETMSKHALNATAALTYTKPGPTPVSAAGRALQGADYISTVILRGDMDALPIHEEVDLPFKSANDGVMHACGHDAHTAMLLGAAKVLKSMEDELIAMGGSVRLMFQPAEEGGAGALRMIQEGGLDGADAAVMIHTNNKLEVGKISSKPGIMNAGTAEIYITVEGVGGHAAYPHTATDVVVAAAAVITGIHGIVSRVLPPTDSAVISLAMVHAGDAFNVLPNTVTIGGTLRTFDVETRDLMMSTIRLRAQSIAASYGCKAVVGFGEDDVFTNSRGVEWKNVLYSPIVNDAEMYEIGKATAEELFEEDVWTVVEQVGMGGEDFSFVSNSVPALMVGLGHRTSGHETDRTASNAHNPRFEMDERGIPRGVAFLASIAVKTIERFNAAKQTVGSGSEL